MKATALLFLPYIYWVNIFGCKTNFKKQIPSFLRGFIFETMSLKIKFQ